MMKEERVHYMRNLLRLPLTRQLFTEGRGSVKLLRKYSRRGVMYVSNNVVRVGRRRVDRVLGTVLSLKPLK